MFEKPYLYTLKDTERFDTGISLKNKLPKPTISFGTKGWWLMINDNGSLIVNKGYSWDGCSPKFKIMGKIYGVPDGPLDKKGRPKTWRASLFHDVLCQYQDDPRMPFSREEIDDIFSALLTADEFEYQRLYYKAVRLLGGPYSKLRKLFKGDSNEL